MHRQPISLLIAEHKQKSIPNFHDTIRVLINKPPPQKSSSTLMPSCTGAILRSCFHNLVKKKEFRFTVWSVNNKRNGP
jgi:hypothetical protein